MLHVTICGASRDLMSHVSRLKVGYPDVYTHSLRYLATISYGKQLYIKVTLHFGISGPFSKKVQFEKFKQNRNNTNKFNELMLKLLFPLTKKWTPMDGDAPV